MATVHEMRESVDARLDQMEAQLTSIEAQLSKTREQAIDQFEKRQAELESAVDNLRAKLDEAKTEGEDRKQRIRQALDHVPVQFALAKAEAHDAAEAANKQLHEATTDLTAAIEHAVDDGVKSAGAQCVQIADKIRAEFEVLSTRANLKKAKARGDFESQKAKILKNIEGMKSDFRKRREVTADRLASFEKELSQAHQHVKDAFTKLVS